MISAEDIAERLGTSVMAISRWRRRFNASPEAFEQAFQEAIAKYPKLLEGDSTAHVGHNTGETEWFTPAAYVEAARQVLGTFDLDPASTADANKVIKAQTFYTAEQDGLRQPWFGRVWMNPPYAQPAIERFAGKLADAVTAGEVIAAIALVNNATETAWFRTLAEVSSAVCFPEGRIQFWHPNKDKAAPLQGQALLYMGPSPPAFQRAYDAFGTVWVKP